jgi:hypothetical protein
VNEPSLPTEVALTVVPFAIFCAFWLTYTDPAKNRLTRSLHSYVEATKYPPLSTSATTLAIAAIMLAVGLASLVDLLLGLWTI